MNPIQWLYQEHGTYTTLAAHLKVFIGCISQMAGDRVPPKYMLSVGDFTDGVVSLESMLNARTTREAGLVDSTIEARMTEAAKAGLVDRSRLVRHADDRAMLAVMRGQGT